MAGKKEEGMSSSKRILFLAMMLVASLLVAACTDDSSTPVPAAPQTQQAPGAPSLGQPGPATSPAAPAVAAPAGIKPTSGKVEYLPAVPMTQLITSKAGPVQTSADKCVNLPVITWGGDVATIYANGNSTKTQPGSIFAQNGLCFNLFRIDDFVSQVEKVVSGATPYLRGTNDQVNSAVAALKDRGIDMVVVYQLTWSTGGDTIVVRSDMVKQASDLCGKPIGVQRNGPHMLYIATVLKDAGCDPRSVNIKWLRELTTPPYDARDISVDPMAAMQNDPTLAAVTVISPDMAAMTAPDKKNCGQNGHPSCDSGGGQEGSVAWAKLLLSTKTAGRVIADVYAVRKDYLDAHRNEVQSFTHSLLQGQEQLTSLYNNRQTRQAEYQALLKPSAVILRDSDQATADIEGMLQDCTFVGYRGNVSFFNDPKELRSFDVLTKEAQTALIGLGLLSAPVPLAQASWDYTVLAQGLKDTAGVTVVAPKFDATKVAQVVAEREQKGSNVDGFLPSFEIFFQPNQNTFTVDQYKEEFAKVVSLAAKYPGAVLIVEGHADPLNYLQQKAKGIPQSVLDQTRQAAKNLSLQRAVAVRENIIASAKAQQVVIDPSQFTVVGAGIDKPKFSSPQSDQEWRGNMRVVFQIIQVEGELNVFAPVGR